MNMKIVLAGAASALLVGSFAVAQTTSDPAQPNAMQPGATDTTTGATTDQSATSATDAGTDTAAQTGDASMAGERG